MNENLSLKLPNTELGAAWINQFEFDDREIATRLLSSLTLVSHTAFERQLQALILSEAAAIEGVVALYATRELSSETNYFDREENEDPMLDLNSVGSGSDLGSEARVAQMIRNLAKTDEHKLLNHPSIEKLRKYKARSIFLVDDIIGSGKRTFRFLNSIWQSRSLRSWHSRHHIEIKVISYTATETGLAKVRASRSRPSVEIVRHCPTLPELPWQEEIYQDAKKLCNRYGRLTSRPKMRLGFNGTMSSLVFEHGCPNNCPSILWAPESGNPDWIPVFPNRSVLPNVASAFPPDIEGCDPVSMLEELSADESQVPRAILGGSPLGIATMTALALAREGLRSRTAISYATGYTVRDCGLLLDRCVARGYLTASLRLTSAGKAELRESGQPKSKRKPVPSLGSMTYYPKELRGHIES